LTLKVSEIQKIPSMSKDCKGDEIQKIPSMSKDCKADEIQKIPSKALQSFDIEGIF
jgi:hypothetical protein